MKHFFKLLSNTILLLNILLGCKYNDEKTLSLFFSHNVTDFYDQNFYNTFKEIYDNKKIISKKELNSNNNLNYWKVMIKHAFKNKYDYFLGLDQNFIKNIPYLNSELEKVSSSSLKFITLDYDFITEEKVSLIKLIEIKFDVFSMGYDLGYRVGRYLLSNLDDFFLENNKINISIVNYENDELALRLNLGFQQGLFNSQLNKKYSFNYILWPLRINMQYPPNSKSIYLLTKNILTKYNVSLLFDPFSWYRSDILKAFYEVNFLKNKKQYIVNINNVNSENYVINNHNFLLATINHNFFPILDEVIKKGSNQIRKLRKEWIFSSSIIDSSETYDVFNHQFFNEEKFYWNPIECNKINAPLSINIC